MVLVRLQVHVLPWQDPTLVDGALPARQEPILPWNEPCDENATIQTLAEQIVARFKSIHVGKGDLNIKYLQDFWGSLLDMTTTVGQTFIDRACGVDISNSIVKVVRFPPTQSELEDPLRCASVAPESSARPRKRGFEEFTERAQTELQDEVYVNTSVPERLISNDRLSKRQRKQARNMSDVGNYLGPILSSEVFENVVPQDSSQTFILQRASSIQVNDSQRSPRVKRRNPYGTPLSFSLQSPQGLVSFNQRDYVAIPESPPSGKTALTENPSFLATEPELGNAKSESPELDSSVPGISKAVNPSKSLQRIIIDDEGFESQNRGGLAVPKSPSLRSDPVNGKVSDSKVPEKLHGQAVISENGVSSSRPRFRLPGQIESNDINATSSKVRDIFDPIETEAEKPQEPQNARRVKRLKSNISLPSEAPGGHQSPQDDIHTGKPTFPHTFQAEKTLPGDLEPLDPHAQNRPSSSANTLEQTLSPAKAFQEIINGAVEGPPDQLRPQNLPLESQTQAGTAGEHASITSEQIRSPPKNTLKEDVQKAHSVEEPPPPPRSGRSQPPKLAGATREVQSRDRTRERKETSGSNDIEEASISSSLGHITKEKQPDEPVAVAGLEDPKLPDDSFRGKKSSHITREKQPDEPVAVAGLEDPKSPDDSFRGKKSKPMNLEEEKSVAKSADRKSEEPKLEDRVRRENARRDKVLRQFTGEVNEVKPLLGKEKPLKATDAKVNKSKVHRENRKDIDSSGKRQMDDRAKPKSVKEVEREKPRKEKAAKEIKMKHAVEGRSGSLTARGAPEKLDSLKSNTPKSRIHSDPQTHSSTTSNPRNDAGYARKSMTPAFPGPALSKKTSAGSRTSIHTSSQQSTIQDSLPQSNTKRTSSTLSRPIAFSKDPSILSSSQELASGILAETDPKARTGGTLHERSRISGKMKQEPNSESLVDTSKNLANQAPKQMKTQTKLNILRDVKGKGRLNDPPIPSQAESQEPIIVSSEDEKSASSSHSDENIHMEKVKAGPSRKRKRSFDADFSNDKSSAKELSMSGIRAPVSKLANTAEKKASPVGDQTIKPRKKASREPKVKIAPELSTSTNPKTEKLQTKKLGENAVQGGAKPRLQTIKQETRTEKPALPPSSFVDSRVGTTIPSSQNSSPRAPARYMSQPVSISSGSDLNADSEADSESNSEPGPESGSDSESDSGIESDTIANARKSASTQPKPNERSVTASQQKSARDTREELTAQENRTAQRKGDSSSLTPLAANSTSLANTVVSKPSKRNSGREADEQLQRECRQSVGPNLGRASSTSSQSNSDEESKLSHPVDNNDGTVESHLRPSNYPYPSMTELKEKRSEKLRSQHLTNGSVSKTTLHNLDPKLLDQKTSSESSSDSENSNDGEQDTNSPKSKTKPFKTMQRILKVADKAKVFAGTQR